MSFELRERITGECTCGHPAHYAWEHYPDHRHDIVCDWGVVEYPHPRPDRGEIGPLMLITTRYLRSLLNDGPVTASWGARYSAETVGDRTFCHIEYQRQRWTWEVFPTHGLDEQILIGRWPD